MDVKRQALPIMSLNVLVVVVFEHTDQARDDLLSHSVGFREIIRR